MNSLHSRSAAVGQRELVELGSWKGYYRGACRREMFPAAPLRSLESSQRDWLFHRLQLRGTDLCQEVFPV